MLQTVASTIRKLSERQDLSTEEIEEAFDICIREDRESYYFFTLTLALHTKGETSDELLGFCKSMKKITPSVPTEGIDPKSTIDVSGTGGDLIKTFNVSTTVAFLVASGGVAVPKQAFFAVTGYTGSIELLQSFGIDVPTISRDPKRVVELLKKTNVVTYHLPLSLPEEYSGMTNWIRKRMEIGLNYITPLHFTAFAYSPFPMEGRIYGIFDERYIRILAELFQKLGYKKGLTFHGVGGLDEISVIGPTKICEFTEEGIKEYTITPTDIGLHRAEVGDIKATSKEGNIKDFLKVLYAQATGPKRELVLANAAAAFYTVGKVKGLKEGVELSASLIDEGKASRKFEEYVAECGDVNKLNELKSRFLE